MGKGQGLLRRAVNVKIGALVAVALLVLAMPTLAFAANTASFSGRAPAGFAVAKPTVSVVVYDRYGARGSSNILLYIDGVRKTPKVTYYAGFGYKKFRVSYAVPTALTQGSHTVLVRVKDLKSLSSSYTWKFTVDSVAPVTNMGGSLPTFTTNATPQLATLQVMLTATDSGSGVATVNYAVDGVTTPGIAGFPFAQIFTKIGPGTHTFSFWSVDKAGNAETPHTMTFFLQPGHALPVSALDTACLAAGCHGGKADVTAIHAAKGCLSLCHTAGTNDCVACHTGTLAPPNHATHVAIDSSATAGSAQDCTNAACHGSSFVTLHGGCVGCHNPQAIANMPSPAVVNAAIAAGAAGSLASCETCHTSMDAAHAPAASHHTVSGACFTSVCHGTDVTKMHGNDFRGTGATPPGCAACHGPGKTPTTACGACHPDLVTPHDVTAAHAKTVPQGITVTADLAKYSAVCASCHKTDLTSVALVSPKSSGVPTSPTGFDEHKGCSCHAYFEADKGVGTDGHVSCQNCHGQPGDTTLKYPYHVDYHGTLVSNLTASPANACTACHGNDVLHVGSRVTATGTVSVPASMTAPVQEHTNCSCHIYGEVKVGAQQTCLDCHSGGYGPIHGWSVELGPRSAGLWTVSGHNTTAYGTVGARTTFTDLGIKDTKNATPTVTMPLTVNNTFKPGVLDSTGAQMGWSSVITCEDCHTGLKANEVAGPHGGSAIANWGIDPAYSGDFATASLWGGKYSQPLADGTTLTIGPFASGIAQWAPKGGDSQELADYQVVTPDMSTASSKLLVAGPATVTDGNVICVKCHDLYDSTKATGYKGWGNYAHEHHSADTGSFKMWFGKFSVTVDGANAGTYTVSSDSMADAKTSVVAAHGGSVTASSTVLDASLGREDAGACRNCHIAIPHGWVRPKLIVYSNMPDPTPGYRASLGLPAVGDSAPYNIGPAVYEGEALNGTGIGSGQMNGLASGPVHFVESTKDINGAWVTTDTPVANLVTEEEDFPYLAHVADMNPALKATGDVYVNWSSAQCNACGHHSSTAFNGGSQPAIQWNLRELNWTSTMPALGAWK